MQYAWIDLELTLFVHNENQLLRENEQMAISPTLQGLGKKIAQFKHDVEFEAAKLSTGVDSARTETMDTFNGAHSALAAHKKDLEDVKSFVAEVAQATNGGPALNSVETASAPGIAADGVALAADGQLQRSEAGGSFVPGVTKY